MTSYFLAGILLFVGHVTPPSATFEWAPATGNPGGYQVCIERNGDERCRLDLVTDTRITYENDWGDVIRVRVWSVRGEESAASEWSDTLRIVPPCDTDRSGICEAGEAFSHYRTVRDKRPNALGVLE
jgi:hypothetical protein